MTRIPDLHPRGIRVYGELEFWFSSIKVITLIGMFDSYFLVTYLDGRPTSFIGLIIFGIIVGMRAMH